jgi:hypothetical protein
LANNSEEKPYHEIPASKYVWMPGDVAVHKSFFLFWSAFMFIGTCILWYTTLYTLMWQTLSMSLYQTFILKYWYITGTATLCIIGSAYFWNKARVAKKQRQHAEAERARQMHLYLKGGDKKK